MTIIKRISEMIEDELESAEEYAKAAIKWKEENPALAKVFYDMSSDELKHVSLLHTEVVRIIEEHRRTHGEPPAAMAAVWDFMHERHIEEANEIRMYHNQYRGV